jgi:pSer/pThr/pTyr-binding forkhead associated (FHA) protein
MRRKSSIGMDKTQPALLVQHGNTAQKHRPLDRAAVTLGQARGCDIELDAPEVSSVHCIITRGSDGLYIRDCNSRMGTRINGERIREGYLHDTDILQVGPFSFQVYVPPSFVTQPEKGPSLTATAAPAEKSSGRAHNDQAAAKEAAAKEAELHQLEESLQKQQQDLEERENQLQEEAKQLAANRAAMQEETKKVQTHAQQWEKDLKQRQAKADEEIQARLKECEHKCAEMEKTHSEALKQKKTSSSAPQSQPSPEKNRDLEIRQQELDKYAKHLQALQQRLREQEDKLRQGLVSQPTPAVVEVPEEFRQAHQEILGKVAQQADSFTEIQQMLQKQHDELIGVLGELSDAQTTTRDQQGRGIEMLRQATELLQALAARSGQPTAPAPLPIPEAAPSTPGPAPKGRDKLVERLRAIDAKIPAVGSRQSRHD